MARASAGAGRRARPRRGTRLPVILVVRLLPRRKVSPAGALRHGVRQLARAMDNLLGACACDFTPSRERRREGGRSAGARSGSRRARVGAAATGHGPRRGGRSVVRPPASARPHVGEDGSWLGEEGRRPPAAYPCARASGKPPSFQWTRAWPGGEGSRCREEGADISTGNKGVGGRSAAPVEVEVGVWYGRRKGVRAARPRRSAQRTPGAYPFASTRGWVVTPPARTPRARPSGEAPPRPPGAGTPRRRDGRARPCPPSCR